MEAPLASMTPQGWVPAAAKRTEAVESRPPQQGPSAASFAPSPACQSVLKGGGLQGPRLVPLPGGPGALPSRQRLGLAGDGK